MLMHDIRNAGEMSGITAEIISVPLFWLVLLITCAICILAFQIVRNGELLFSGSIINNLRRNKYYHEYEKKFYLKKLEQMNRCRRTLVKFKRLYKQNDYEVENYADKRMKEMVDMYRNEHDRRKTLRSRKNRAMSEHNHEGTISAFKKIINKIEKPNNNTFSENVQTPDIKNIQVKETMFNN
jgi:hypothetical protein